MSDGPLTNAAVEVARRAHDFLNACTEAPTEVNWAVTDDFTLEDRRSGGVNFGQLDASIWEPFVGSTWDVGAGRPHYSIQKVLAVRGARSAAMIVVVDFEHDPQIAFINCLHLDRGLRRAQRMVSLDLDDVDAAMTELDQFHAALED